MTDAQIIASIRSSLIKAGQHQDVITAHGLIKQLIQKGGCPDSYFTEFVGAGSYKEAWQVESLCIKFAADNIQDEIDVYNAAAQYNIQHMFCPTFFHRLPETSSIYCSEMDEIQSPVKYPKAAYIIIQPAVSLRNDLTCLADPYEYEGHAPLILNDGTKLSGYEYCQIDAPYEWRQSVIQYYGDAGYRDLVWGLRRLDVEDLHAGNVGWIDDRPIILDWLSYTKPSCSPDL